MGGVLLKRHSGLIRGGLRIPGFIFRKGDIIDSFRKIIMKILRKSGIWRFDLISDVFFAQSDV